MIFVVGIGPGSPEHMTQRALDALGEADVVVGYSYYIELLGEVLRGKEVLSTGMTREVERCEKAVELALSGKKVAVVSTGDPGVYGMAGLVIELLGKMDPEGAVELEIVPGVSAVGSAASILGAPLMTDFAVISLSDLLTPWELIEKRLKAAAEGDFIVALYNPRSKKRVTHLARACEILSAHRPPHTPVGIVKNALREGQEVILATLSAVPFEKVDMMSVVIIGNSTTKNLGGRMVTPRGYGID